MLIFDPNVASWEAPAVLMYILLDTFVMGSPGEEKEHLWRISVLCRR